MESQMPDEAGVRARSSQVGAGAAIGAGEGVLNVAQINAMFVTKTEADQRGSEAPEVAQAGYQHAATLELSEMLSHFALDSQADPATPYPHSSEGLLWLVHYMLGDMLYGRREPSGEPLAMFEAAMRDGAGHVEFDGSPYLLDSLSIVQAVRLQLGLLTVGRYSVPLFGRVLAGCDLTWADMQRLFVSKTLLALFRLDHGYQSGRYVTMWNGRKDVEHLMELMSAMEPSSEDYFKQIYGAMQRRYVASLSGAEGS